MEPDSPENSSVHNWVPFDSHENQESDSQNEDDEALSLCYLATNKQDDPAPINPEEHEEDFDFGGAASNLPENQMCSADEVFFRGQILPLRHSVSSSRRNLTRSVSFSRSEPVSAISSRSSSTRSRNSASSGSSTSASSEGTGYKPRIRNHFHSQPSPAPQIRTQSFRQTNPKTPSKWSFLQLGLLKPQEIGLADLKNRSKRSTVDPNHRIQKKEKQRLTFGGCRCSANAIESTVSSATTMVKRTNLTEEQTRLGISKESNIGRRKHAVSSQRTFDWLKQLSLQETAPLL